MLLRILIVDDESYIADSTAMLLDNSLEGETDIQVFYDAEDALARMKRVKTDILVTDIRMPGMDGMELTRRVHKLWPTCEVILLTAYTEFQYAYEAIKQKHVDYVLKHEGFEAIQRAVVSAIGRIESAGSRENILRAAQSQANAALPWLQREYIMDIMRGQPAAPSQEMDNLALGVDITRPLRMLMVYVHDCRECENLFERSRRFGAIREAARMYLPDDVRLCQLPVDTERLLWLMQFEQARDAQFEGLIESVQDGVSCQTGFSVSFAYSGSELSAQDYPDMYARLESLSEMKALSGARMWLACADEARALGDAAIDMQWPGNTRREQTLARLENCPDPDSMKYRHVYMSAALPLIRLVENMELTPEQRAKLDIDMLYNMAMHSSGEDAAAYLRGVEQKLKEYGRSNIDESANRMVETLRAFVADNMAGDISLTALAECVHLNASYLSRVFKQQTGENLNDFIRAQRLSRACELLARPDVKMYEICAQVGFATPAYFSYFFKKEMGMTPKEYRDRHKD